MPAREQTVEGRSLATFALLVVAAGVGLGLTQSLRHSDPVVIGVRRTAVFSPTGSGPRSAVLSFWLKRPDRVAVTVVDARDDLVRTISGSRSVPSRTRVNFVWNGTDELGRRAPDGRYRFRVGLAQQGRSLTLPQAVRLDTQPARPWIASVNPVAAAGPFVFPANGRAAGIVRGTPGHQVSGIVIRTDSAPPRVVSRFPLPDRARTVPWNGRLSGKLAPDGIYMLGIEETDPAGNRGSYPPTVSPLPDELRGRSGVTVRRLAAIPPTLPFKPGGVVTVIIDSRRADWKWALRAVGSERALARGKGSGSAIRLRIPKRASGLLLLAVAANGRRISVPIMVNRSPRPLLVVLPAIRWQGIAPVDQSGDGLPDTLPNGRAVSLNRLNPFAKGGLPELGSSVVPLLKFLARIRQPAELTTDAALAQGRGPKLSGHTGAVFLGSTWLPPALLAGLRRWVGSGGRVLDIGPDDLRRTIAIDGEVISRPSLPLPSDAFGGVRAEPVVTGEYLTPWKDEIGLFSGAGGLIDGQRGWAGTARVKRPGLLVAAAGPSSGIAAVAAWRLGKGLVIHTGLTSLATDALQLNQSAQLLRNAVRLTANGKP